MPHIQDLKGVQFGGTVVRGGDKADDTQGRRIVCRPAFRIANHETCLVHVGRRRLRSGSKRSIERCVFARDRASDGI